MSHGEITGYRSIKFKIQPTGWIMAEHTVNGIPAGYMEFADTPRGRTFGREFFDVCIPGLRPRRMPWNDVRNGISHTFTMAERG